METSHHDEALRILRRSGESADTTLDVFELGLAFGAINRPAVDLTPYRAHREALVADARALGPAPRIQDRLEILRDVLVTRHQYHGIGFFETLGPRNDARSLNLLDVIDRRYGGALTMGLLHLQVAQSLGWPMVPVECCGALVLKLEAQDGAILLDPAHPGRTCTAQQLFDIQNLAVVRAEGEGAQQTPPETVPVSRRALLLMLQHRLKDRLLAQGLMDAGISALQAMILLAPRNQQLWRELGDLQARRGSLRAAITALEVVCSLCDEAGEVQRDLKDLRRKLN